VFEDLGVLDATRAAGGPYPRFRVHVGSLSFPAGGLHKVVAPSPSVPFPNLWMVPQWRTEEILRGRLAELGAQVEFGASVTAFEQDSGGVTATLRTAAGIDRVRADYLVGCDGGHSFVRNALGVGFEGESMPTPPVVCADVEIDGLDRTRWHVWPLAKGCLFTLCPLPGTSWFQLAAPLRGRAVPPEPSEDGIRDFVEARIGVPGVRVRSVGWASVFRPQVRMADRYRVGRVLLCGDAAHVHPPSGGQGLNTGVQDAYNLGWKLANVLRGAPGALLDTYETERLPIAASVLGLSKRLMLRMSRGRGAETQQLGLHYRDRRLAVHDADKPGRVRAGDRAPDAPCFDETGAPRRLFEVLRGTHFTLLAFGDGNAEVVASAQVNSSATVKVVHVLRPGEPAVPRAIVDAAGHARRAYGVGDASTQVLVRPDG
jgi:2-polyprenyl-6-methoxyphenol hydroxylase-like FAD-dependent oxidoreductase